MPSKFRSLVQAHKPDMKINLDSRKETYATLDRIEGTVTITAVVDTNFDAIDIEFVGTARTYVERPRTADAASGRSKAFHEFLKLQQPSMHLYYPDEEVLKAGVTYHFPFEFAVPQQLLPRICQHPVHNDTVRDAHLRLPPTFSDKHLANRQKVLEDIAPDMASIRYCIFARITEIKARGDEAWRSVVSSKARRIRVIPAVEEQPPLDVHVDGGEYKMRKEKIIRKGMLKSKVGSLVMEAAQPQSVKLDSFSDPEGRHDTMAIVKLRFDPLDEDSPPPKLGSLSSKLKITTYFASTARHFFPTKAALLMDMSQGFHNEQLSLSSRCVSNVDWKKIDPSDSDSIERRDSTISTISLHIGETPAPSEGYKGKAYYVARLLVPVQLPTNKVFVPSFHSCLISRVYALKFDLSISSSGIGPSVELKVPLQISSKGLMTNISERRESIDLTSDTETDIGDISGFFNNYFEPRAIRVAPEVFIGRSRIGSQTPTENFIERGRMMSQAPTEETHSDTPPDYSPHSAATTARMTHYRAIIVPVY